MAIPIEIYKQSWHLLAMTAFSIVAIFVSKLILNKSGIVLPTEFSLFLTLFIYGSVFLGEGQDFYTKFWWWDLILHTSSGVVFGFVGFLILYILYKRKRLQSSIFLVAMFAFCFSVAIGALWEILEFTTDRLFGTNMQRSGLVDTMKDLIVDTFGALFTAVCGFIYLKKGGDEGNWFEILLDRFIKQNPRLFKKTKKQ